MRGHVQSTAQVGTAAEDVAFAAPFAALAGEGRDPDQGGNLARAKRAQLRQARNQDRTGNRPDPGHAGASDPLGGSLLELALNACSMAAFSASARADAPDALADRRIARLLTAIALGRDYRDQLLTAAHQLGQSCPIRRHRGRRRLKLFAEAAQPLGVEPIGFGQLPAGLSKMIRVTRTIRAT